jgi:hypothetical protein
MVRPRERKLKKKKKKETVTGFEQEKKGNRDGL